MVKTLSKESKVITEVIMKEWYPSNIDFVKRETYFYPKADLIASKVHINT